MKLAEHWTSHMFGTGKISEEFWKKVNKYAPQRRLCATLYYTITVLQRPHMCIQSTQHKLAQGQSIDSQQAHNLMSMLKPEWV